MMRAACLTLSLLLASCDSLWNPACLADPGQSGCQLSYQPATRYLAPGSKQTLLLRAQGLDPQQAQVLRTHQAEVSATLQYNPPGQERELPLTIKEILPNGDILIGYPFPQDILSSRPRIVLRIGRGEPIQIAMGMMSIGCSRMDDYSEVKLGRSVNSPEPFDTSWIGSRENLDRAFFIIKKRQISSAFGDLHIMQYNSRTKKAEEISKIGTLVDSSCQTVSTKNIAMEYCYRSEAGIDSAKRWFLHLLDPKLNNKTPCNEINSFYCDDFSPSQFLLGSSRSDSLAIVHSNFLHIIDFRKTDSDLYISPMRFPLQESGISQIEKLNFFDLDFDGRDDLIGYDVKNEAFVYKNTSAGFRKISTYNESLTAALGRINEQDARPADALAIANLYGDNTPTLLVAKDKDLWLGVIAAGTGSPQEQPSLAHGSLLLKDAFPQKPERLELIDLNEDGFHDLVAVTASAAYLCPTLAAGG